MSSSELY